MQKSVYKSTDFSLAVGLGYYAQNQVSGFDLRYNPGFANIEDNSSGSGKEGSVRNNVIQLSIFYMFTDKD